MLATRQQIKDRLGVGAADTEFDTVLDTVLRNVSSLLAGEAGRILGGAACLEKSTAVELLSPSLRDDVIWLTARPIVSITEVTEALYGAHATATALVAGTDYWANLAAGRLTRIGQWLAGDETVSATYIGGYVLALPWVSGTSYVAGDAVTSVGVVYECILATDGTTVPADDATHWTAQPTWTALPGDINEAAIQQSQFYFERRVSLGQTSQGVQGASFQNYAKDTLLPGVRETMRHYQRVL